MMCFTILVADVVHCLIRPPLTLAKRHLFSRSFLHSSTSLPRVYRGLLFPVLRSSSAWRQPCRLSIHQPTRRAITSRASHSLGFDLIDPSVLIEEETIPNFKAQRYYPVSAGQVFNDRYEAVGKLGYGSSSTVWLCRDLKYIFSHVAMPSVCS